MKLIVICALFFASALADERPIYQLPEWWAARTMDPTLFIQNQMRAPRVIGGREARVNQFPYQAGLRLFIQNSNNVGLCGGSLVSHNRVVTAAHCVDIVSGLEVVLGAHFLNREEATQQRRTVALAGLIWHAQYNPNTLENDVAIINLPTPVSFTSYISPINLPAGADLNDDFTGQEVTASGWGRFSGSSQASSEFLRYVRTNVISNNACRIRFPGIIRDSTICISGSGPDGNVGVCNGDSGGPLTVVRNGQSTLVGIASFVSGLGGCEGGWPSGFARVTSFEAWIRARL